MADCCQLEWKRDSRGPDRIGGLMSKFDRFSRKGIFGIPNR